MPQTTVDRQSARRRAVTGIAATALVGDVAEKLAPHGIWVMPLKGVLLQHWLYDDPSERAMTDADVLLPADHLPSAVHVLEGAGYQRTSHQSLGGVVMQTPFGVALDLHPELFDPARYRLSAHDVFARSIEDSTLYSAPVRVPAALDVYAHLVGKAGSDHLDARAIDRIDEIRRMGRWLEASPRKTSKHLVACGMGRVARYVLSLVHQTTGDAFAMEVEASLPRDMVGRGIVAIAGRVFASASPTSNASAVLAHLLNDSLPRGVRSGLRALRDRPRL